MSLYQIVRCWLIDMETCSNDTKVSIFTRLLWVLFALLASRFLLFSTRRSV
jgi:hypothetical protein